MRRTAFAIAAITVGIAVASICGIQRGHREEERQADGDFAISFRCPQQVAWDDGMRLAMRWDEARKKMLFDRKKVIIDSMYAGARIELARPLDDTDEYDEYDFDTRPNANFCPSLDSVKQDGRVHYTVEWDNIGKQTVSLKAAEDHLKEILCNPVYTLWAAHNGEGGPASRTGEW